MNDTLAVKDLAISTIGATQLPGTARNFARIVSQDAAYRRISTHIGSLSPTTIRVSHQPRKSSSGKQRSLFAVDQTLTRLDAQNNPILVTDLTAGFTLTIPGDVTEDEVVTAASTLLGALLENNGANIRAMFRGEV